MENAGGILNLLINVPVEIRNKIIGAYNFEDPNSATIEVIVLYSSTPEVVSTKIEALGGKFEDLGYGYGIVTIGAGALIELSGISEINYIELPKNLFLSYEPSNRAACILSAREVYGLNGEGILVGFIDSGIAYTNNAFRTDTGETRIDFIYDLEAGGIIYTKEDINNALKNSNPYSIVPHRDRVGHGTHVAGIACGGGKIPQIYYGVAPKSSIAMVKMARETGKGNGKSTQLMRGLKFLIDKASEISKPLAVNISFSTNDGAHNGSSLLEQYISIVSATQRVTIAIAAGNEGARSHHVGGTINSKNFIQFNVGQQEKILILQTYKSVLNDFTLRLISPTGSSVDGIPSTKTLSTGRLINDQYFIYNTGPTPFNIDGEYIIVLAGTGDGYITPGIWTMEIDADNKYLGTFDIWLPIAEGLSENTRFLNPTISNTVGIPGTVKEIITVGSYNYTNQTISSFSGRGNSELNPVKPDLVAPGEDIVSATPEGNFEPLSGTSMATPAVAGASALLMEFGILKGRDPYLYGERVKYYLIKGAGRRRSDVEYPNNSWGYGTLCLEQAIKIWEREVATR